MTTSNNTLPTLTAQTEAKRLTLAVRDFVFDTRKAATLEDGAKLWASLEESFASALTAAEERGRGEGRAAVVTMLDGHMRGCEETAKRLADSEEEADNNMYWRADGAADAIEDLIQRVNALRPEPAAGGE